MSALRALLQVKRRTAKWGAVDCRSLPYFCASHPSPGWSGVVDPQAKVVDTRPPPCVRGRASCTDTEWAVPRLEASDECPSREDVMNTLSGRRWALWDDAACADGCALAYCKGGAVAPCCVRRQRAVFRVPCEVPEPAQSPHGARPRRPQRLRSPTAPSSAFAVLCQLTAPRARGRCAHSPRGLCAARR